MLSSCKLFLQTVSPAPQFLYRVSEQSLEKQRIRLTKNTLPTWYQTTAKVGGDQTRGTSEYTSIETQGRCTVTPVANLL